MVDKLSLFNGALRVVGERKLASLTENRPSRYLLDSAWDDNAVDYVLEMGSWVFATRTMEYTYSPSIEPDFGFPYAFNIPDDHIRTVAICSDEFFQCPLLQRKEEAGYWFASLDKIYVRYVSNDAAYGNDYSLWPMTFVKFFQAYLALEIAPDLKNFSDLERVKKVFKERLDDALSKDALADPTAFPPMGSWASSRLGGGSRYRGER
jgi:hypothetical protein